MYNSLKKIPQRRNDFIAILIYFIEDYKDKIELTLVSLFLHDLLKTAEGMCLDKKENFTFLVFIIIAS